jgi:hypothetical protein
VRILFSTMKSAEIVLANLSFHRKTRPENPSRRSTRVRVLIEQHEATVSALIVSAQGGAGGRGASKVRLHFLCTHLRQHLLDLIIFWHLRSYEYSFCVTRRCLSILFLVRFLLIESVMYSPRERCILSTRRVLLHCGTWAFVRRMTGRSGAGVSGFIPHQWNL